MARLTASPRPLTAVLAGVIVFFPSLTFLAAVQVVGTARAGVGLTSLGLALVVFITVASVWVPISVYLAMPGTAVRVLTAFNAWLRANVRYIVVGGLSVGGAFLAVSSLLALAGS
jgi:hypothetical protein